MKTSWPRKTLDEICQVRGGGTPSKAVERYWRGDIPWVSPKDMKFDVVSDSLDHISREAIDGSATSLIPKDSVLMVVRSGILARTVPIAITGRDLTINQDLKALCPNRGVDARFLYHLLDSKMDVLLSMVSRGATVHRLVTDQIRTLDFILPPLPEQQRIVGILDEAFAGIARAKANAEQNLQNARALFESHLQSVFTQRGEGWVEKPLAELCDSSRVITYGVIKLGEEVPDGIPCLRTSNVRWLRIETDGMKRIAPALSSEYSRTILKGGEVLVNVRGTLGGVAVAAPEMAGWNVSREVAVVPVNSSRVNPTFLSYLIGSGTSQHWLGSVKKGAAYVGINIEDLRLLPVSAPALNKQLEVVWHLESLEEETQRLEAIYQQKLAALDEFKKSLLHQAFTGQL